MYNLNKLTNEELALLYKKNKKDVVFEEIYKRFKRMVYKFQRKHEKYNRLSKDEISSACHLGLYNGIIAYDTDKTVALSTVIYRYIQTAIEHRYKYYKSYNRGYLINNSISINKPINDDTDTPLVDIINYENSEESYFHEQYANYSESIRYGMSKVKNDLIKPYLIPMLLGDYSMMEVAREINCKHQNVDYHLRKFKNHVKWHLETIGLGDTLEKQIYC